LSQSQPRRSRGERAGRRQASGEEDEFRTGAGRADFIDPAPEGHVRVVGGKSVALVVGMRWLEGNGLLCQVHVEDVVCGVVGPHRVLPSSPEPPARSVLAAVRLSVRSGQAQGGPRVRQNADPRYGVARRPQVGGAACTHRRLDEDDDAPV
jgi:hypothetical protein